MPVDEALDLRRPDAARATISRRSSRAASSSASRSRARSSSGPTCCCATSRPARSTTSTGKLVLEVIARINRELGTTADRHHAQRRDRRHGRSRHPPRRRAASQRIERNARKLAPAELVLVKALDRKLLRDLRRLRSQALTIALVVASGVGGFVTGLSAVDSLALARDRFYADGALRRRVRRPSSARRTRWSTRLRDRGVADVQTTRRRVVRVAVAGLARSDHRPADRPRAGATRSG